MANEEYLKILEQGVDAWNQWRKQNPWIRISSSLLAGIDLTGANLRAAELNGANLSHVNLYGADLRGVNLRQADLSSAVLSKADLTSFHPLDLSWSYFEKYGEHFRDKPADDSSRLSFLTAEVVREAFEGLGIVKDATPEFKNLMRVPRRVADLSEAKLTGAKIYDANLRQAKLIGADLQGASFNLSSLYDANLTRANLRNAEFRHANLIGAVLAGADLTEADFTGANLSMTNLIGANLRKAKLELSNLVYSNLEGANLSECSVFGISAWELNLKDATQTDLVITREAEPAITVDNLEVAQFIYLMLNNEKIRDVIDTITSKAVLILGRFTKERKIILDAIREEIRKRGYLPILFDFEKPATQDLTETVTTLARMSRFIIADITDPRSIPQELYAIVPHLPSVPVLPLLATSATEYGMFDTIKRYPWVLETHHYDDLDDLLVSIDDKVITPADEKARQLRGN